MTNTMKIITLVVIPILVLAIGLGIFLAVSNGDSGDDPVETLPPVEDTTNPNESDTDNKTPSIPDIEPDESVEPSSTQKISISLKVCAQTDLKHSSKYGRTL